MTARTKAIIAVLALLFLAGIAAGWYFFKPVKVVEQAAPEVVQTDGSVVVEKAPDATAKPSHQIPRGTKVERIVHVTAASSKTDCPPVTVDLSMVRQKDGQKRVVASSPDGQIVKAIDIPVENAIAPEEPKHWAAGLSWSPNRQTAGIWIERDIARIRIGAEVNQARQAAYAPTDLEARIRVGWTF